MYNSKLFFKAQSWQDAVFKGYLLLTVDYKLMIFVKFLTV